MFYLLAQENAVGREVSAGMFVVLAIIYVGFFAWLTFLAWAKTRRREREAFYQHEVEKRIVESSGAMADQLRNMRTDDARRRWVLRRESLKLTGLVMAACGIGFYFGLQFVPKEGIQNLGWVPLAIGAAILFYVYVMSPKSPGD